MFSLPSLDWADPNFHWVLFASVLLGMATAALGCFALLRGRSLLGDALAHAALPGVCLMFIFATFAAEQGWFKVDPKNFWLLLLGALLASLAAAQCIAFITRNSRIKEDAAQAIVLTVFFGFGVVLLTRIQHTGSGEQSGLDKFLFGQAATLVANDVRSMAVLAVVILALIGTFFKEFKLLCFDPGFGAGMGLRINRFDGLLLLLLVGAVVSGLQAVGVVLISALLIIPAAAARFWTDRLNVMVPLAAGLGGASGALGAVISALAPRLPTGPFMVLAATTVFVISLLFAPHRGALARLVRQLSTRKRVRQENVLRDLFELSSRSVGEDAVTEADLARRRRLPSRTLHATLRELAAKNWVRRDANGHWILTVSGAEAGYEVVRRHRLWEAFLMQEAALGAVVADRDAEAVEHFLPPDAVAQLEGWLRQQGREPRPLQVVK